jgi:tetratricopeptide (TPR) repeat protein
MAHDIACPSCKRSLRLESHHVGVEVSCPSCRETFVPDGPEGALEVIPVVPSHALREAPRNDEPLRWWDGPPEPPLPLPKKKGKLLGPTLLVVGLVLLVSLICLGVPATLLYLEHRSSKQAAMAPVPPDWDDLEVDNDKAPGQVRQAFHRHGPIDDAGLVKELAPLFAELGDALSRRDGRAAADLFDPRRMAEEVGEDAMPARVRRDPGFVRGMRLGLVNSFSRDDGWEGWTATEIKSVKKLGNDVVVIARHRCKDGSVEKIRWWLTARSGGWKVYDFEDLNLGLRSSYCMALVTRLVFRGDGVDPAGQARARQLNEAVRGLTEAHTALSRDDVDTAERKLGAVADEPLPRRLQAYRLFIQGEAHLVRSRPKEALAAFEKAHGLQPDMPVLDMERGVALNMLGEWARGLKHLQAYHDLLGDDPRLCQAMGDCLRGLSRFKEAQVAYRKSLDDNPKNPDAFLGLLRALNPGDKRDDVPGRFARLDKRRETFEVCA